MPYAVAATWHARQGEEEAVAEILRAVAPLCRAEDACRVYQAHRSEDDPGAFFIYELYDDEAGFQAHVDSAHYQQYVRDRAVPLLERREVARYLTME